MWDPGLEGGRGTYLLKLKPLARKKARRSQAPAATKAEEAPATGTGAGSSGHPPVKATE